MIINDDVCMREEEGREGDGKRVFLPILSWGLARVYDCERLKHKEETESPTYHHRWIKRWMVEIRFKDSDCLVRIIRRVQGLKEGEEF